MFLERANMQDVIHLLPDHIANQIAAGEVVQRPSSVVKELMENALDAGATCIELIMKDAGKALIQVIDNGCGMSAQDARMAFERHATSKIKEPGDLFNIRTMGFRGEAMASIAAVSQVNLRTRLQDAELGTEIQIEGSTIKQVEPCMTVAGSNISVKNLFYNVPARRNFLKSNPVETRHILNEFTRVALANPNLNFRLEHNGNQVYDLFPTHLEQRIVNLFGKFLHGNLIHIKEETPYISIRGYLGKPETARRKRGDQYFFVNNRFIKSGYLNHSVTSAFSQLIPDDTFPFYCIFFEIDPSHIDINIHPTKTEIKFDDERTIYQLLHSVIRKGLGDYHKTPVEMEDQGFIDLLNQTEIPSNDEKTIGGMQLTQPQSKPSVNPNSVSWGDLYPSSGYSQREESRLSKGSNLLFPGLDDPNPQEESSSLPFFEEKGELPTSSITQLGGRYLLHQREDGLVVIDQCHAHQRILYERFLKASLHAALPSQQLLFPRTLHFSPIDFSFLREIEEDIKLLGFDLSEFGSNTFILHGIPALLKGSKAELFFEDIIAEVREAGEATQVGSKVQEALAKAIARKTAMPTGKKLNPQEMIYTVETLFQCEQPGISPSGKPTFYRLELKELEQFFQG